MSEEWGKFESGAPLYDPQEALRVQQDRQSFQNYYNSQSPIYDPRNNIGGTELGNVLAYDTVQIGVPEGQPLPNGYDRRDVVFTLEREINNPSSTPERRLDAFNLAAGGVNMNNGMNIQQSTEYASYVYETGEKILLENEALIGAQLCKMFKRILNDFNQGIFNDVKVVQGNFQGQEKFDSYIAQITSEYLTINGIHNKDSATISAMSKLDNYKLQMLISEALPAITSILVSKDPSRLYHILLRNEEKVKLAQDRLNGAFQSGQIHNFVGRAPQDDVWFKTQNTYGIS